MDKFTKSAMSKINTTIYVALIAFCAVGFWLTSVKAQELSFQDYERIASTTKYALLSVEEKEYSSFELIERILLELQSINSQLRYLTHKY